MEMIVYAVSQTSHLYRALAHILASDAEATLVLFARVDGLRSEFIRMKEELKRHRLIRDVHVHNIAWLREPRYLWDDVRIRSLVRSLPRVFEVVSFGWSGEGAFRWYTPLLDAASLVTLVEDAPIQCVKAARDASWLKRVVARRVFGATQLPLNSSKIKAIYVSDGGAHLPSSALRAKPIHELAGVDAVPEVERDWICHVFKCPEPARGDLDASIVLTQPLSADIAAVTRSDQIRVYSEIVKRLTGSIYLKRHPRDDVEYPFADSVTEIRQFVPTELMRDRGLSFKRAVGLSSNAIDSVVASDRLKLYPEASTDWNLEEILASIDERLGRG